jgi:hypothetical protein
MFEGQQSREAEDLTLSAIWRDSVGVAPVMALAAEPLTGRTPGQLLELLSGWERQAAWIAARQTQLIAMFAQQTRAEYAASRRDAEERGRPVVFSEQDVENDIEAEVGVALRLSSRAAGARVTTAQALCGRLSATHDALAAGQISYWHAAAIEQETRHLTDQAAQAVEAKVLARAGDNTVAGLRRRLRRAAAIVTPNSDADRAREAKAAREVTFTPQQDGMASLTAFGPAPDLQAVFDVLDILAGRTPASDARPMAARRFDALVDAVLGRAESAHCPDAPRTQARVHVTMDLPTLLGLRNNPAELHGYGPLPAPLARALAADNGWQRLIHDPITGAPLDLGRTPATPAPRSPTGSAPATKPAASPAAIAPPPAATLTIGLKISTAAAATKPTSPPCARNTTGSKTPAGATSSITTGSPGRVRTASPTPGTCPNPTCASHPTCKPSATWTPTIAPQSTSPTTNPRITSCRPENSNPSNSNPVSSNPQNPASRNSNRPPANHHVGIARTPLLGIRTPPGPRSTRVRAAHVGGRRLIHRIAEVLLAAMQRMSVRRSAPRLGVPVYTGGALL